VGTAPPAAGPAPTPVVVAVAPLAVVLAAWLAIAALGVARLVRERRAFVRALGARERVTDAALQRWVRRLSPERAVRLTSAAGAATPMALGRGELCLPTRALDELTDDELRGVLAHEVAHLRRRDPQWAWAAALVARVCWLQPLNRAAGARLRLLAECLCDDWALRQTRAPAALARALARVAGWLAPGRAGALAVGMAASESLAVWRVRRMLADPLGGDRAPGRRGVVGALAVAPLALVVALAPAVAPPRADAPAGPAVSRHTITAVDDAGPFTLTLDRGAVVAMTIDGRPVPTSRLRRVGDVLQVHDEAGGRELDLVLTSGGGIRWTSRARRP
jgi:beta-lactamase regulating signal transducer with metallopeptidase domain